MLMALPKRTALCRVLRRHRQKERTLPPVLTDLNFNFPPRFDSLPLFDSGPGDDRLLMLGDTSDLNGLARSNIWIADGMFKIVPSLYFQLYGIHFQFVGRINPAAMYCLLTNKTQGMYNRLIDKL